MPHSSLSELSSLLTSLQFISVKKARQDKSGGKLSVRRKSLPATMSPVQLEAFGASTAEPLRNPSGKSKSSRRQPLDGGTLVHEGKTFKAPSRESEKPNLPLKQAQVCVM